MKEELSAFFNPTYLIASKLVHEYSHFKFWKQHGALGKTKQIKEQNSSNFGLENERYALTEERNFLKQVIETKSPNPDITLFRVKSWDQYGQPVCDEIRKEEFVLQENILQRIDMLESTIKQMTSQKDYSKEMSKCARENQFGLSSILKLSFEKEDWPTVTMKI